MPVVQGTPKMTSKPRVTRERDLNKPSHVAFTDAPSSQQTLTLLRMIQRYSAYAFLCFSLMHMFSVVVAPVVSPALGSSAIQLTRIIYQSSLGEPVLVWGAALVHLATSWSIHIGRIKSTYRTHRKWDMRTTSIQKSGMILSLLTLGHFIATRLGVIVYLNGNSNSIGLEYIRWGMTHGLQGSVSMVILVMVYSFHALSGLNRWQRLGLSNRSRYLFALGAGLMSILSLVRISNLPLPSSQWQLEQYETAFAVAKRLS